MDQDKKSEIEKEQEVSQAIKNKKWWQKIITRFLQGLLIVVPIGLIVFLIVWIFGMVDGFLSPYVERILIKLDISWWPVNIDGSPRYIPGMAFMLTLVIIYLVGILASNWVGRRIVSWFEGTLRRIPLVKQVYGGVQQIIKSVSGIGQAGTLSKAAFREVVIVEFPRPGMQTVAFITNEIRSSSGVKLYNIYIPSAPFMTGGYYEIVTEDMITRTKITVDEAIQMVFSGGMITPDVVTLNDNLLFGNKDDYYRHIKLK